jgi:hypothetical protein
VNIFEVLNANTDARMHVNNVDFSQAGCIIFIVYINFSVFQTEKSEQNTTLTGILYSFSNAKGLDRSKSFGVKKISF